MAAHSGILAWTIPRTEKPSRLQSIGSQTIATTSHALKYSTGNSTQYSIMAYMGKESKVWGYGYG